MLGSVTCLRHHSASVSAYPAERVAVDAETLFHDGRGESPRDQDPDQRNDAELVLAHRIVRAGQCETDRLADDHEQVRRDPGLAGNVAERSCTDRSHQGVEGVVEPSERELPRVERLADRIERQPRAFEPLIQPNTPDVAVREATARGSGEDPCVDEALHESGVDSGAIRHVRL